MRNLDHPVLASAKSSDSLHAKKGNLQHAFPLDVLMVPLSAINVAANGERLMCSGFSLGKLIHLGNFEFINDYFGGLSLSPRRGDSGTAFTDSTCSGTSSPRWAMIEDSAIEFLTTSSEHGGFGLPSPRRRGTRASLAPITATPWLENAPATQATMTVPPRMEVPQISHSS
jgi:hypothetical protein